MPIKWSKCYGRYEIHKVRSNSMTIYLVRHGESQSNYDNKHFRSYFCGQLDVPLTDSGTKVQTIYVIILKRNRLNMYMFQTY